MSAVSIPGDETQRRESRRVFDSAKSGRLGWPVKILAIFIDALFGLDIGR